MNFKVTYPAPSDIEKMCLIAEKIFSAEADTTQTKPTVENTLDLISIEKNTLVCIKENGEVVAWTVVLPTSKNNMNRFLSGEITERELSFESKKDPSFEALYLMAGITLPLYRKRGLSLQLITYQIDYFKHKYNMRDFYSLPFSESGKSLIQKISANLNIIIKIPSNI